MERTDLIVLGSGPAGLSAGIYGGSEGLKVHVFERTATVGGQIKESSALENLAGFPFGISGRAFVNRAYKQAKRMGATFTDSVTIDRIERHDGRFLAYVGSTLVADSRTVLLATGVEFRILPNIPVRPGVHYGHVIGTGAEHKSVVVVGGGNSAGQAIVHLAHEAEYVSVVIRGMSLRESMSSYLVDRIESFPNVKVIPNANITTLEGTAKRLKGVCLDTDLCVPASRVYVFVGQKPPVIPLAEVNRDPEGYIKGDKDTLATNVPGVFVAGDAKQFGVKRVTTAMSDGAVAIHGVHRYFAESGLLCQQKENHPAYPC